MAGILKFLVPVASPSGFVRNFSRIVRLLVTLLAAQASLTTFAVPITIDFESLADSEAVAAQFAGLSFSNATALSAGISLNEFEFPPRSGANVLLDDGGALSITFTAIAQSFGAYFTYSSSLTLKAFDGAANLLTSVTSDFSSNSALSGDAGSSPNEFLNIAVSGIRRIVIEGDPGGGSFVMEDLIYEEATNGGGGSTPEPGTIILFLAALIAAVITKKSSNRRAVRVLAHQ
jgi:hypothetical protein